MEESIIWVDSSREGTSLENIKLINKICLSNFSDTSLLALMIKCQV